MGQRTRRRMMQAMLPTAAATALSFLAAGGCDKPPTTPRASTSAATMPAAAAAAAPAAQASTRPTFAVMNIDGHRVIFPAARLRLEDAGDHVNALLFSDDPPEAIKDNYQGNSFYLPMVLDIEDPKSLPGATWSHKSTSAAGEREDTPYGIYLSGRRTQLVPFDVRAKFSKGEPTTLMIAGQFLVVRDMPTTAGSDGAKGLPQTAVVAAELPVRVDPPPKKD